LKSLPIRAISDLMIRRFSFNEETCGNSK